MNKRNLTPAPIDNKNILEDFADTIVCEFDDGIAERQTFWRDRCLYLVDYAFGPTAELSGAYMVIQLTLTS